MKLDWATTSRLPKSCSRSWIAEKNKKCAVWVIKKVAAAAFERRNALIFSSASHTHPCRAEQGVHACAKKKYKIDTLTQGRSAHTLARTQRGKKKRRA